MSEQINPSENEFSAIKINPIGYNWVESTKSYIVEYNWFKSTKTS